MQTSGWRPPLTGCPCDATKTGRWVSEPGTRSCCTHPILPEDDRGNAGDGSLMNTQPGLATVIRCTTDSQATDPVHGPRGILTQQHTGGDWAWMVNDGLGSVRGVLDDSFDPLYGTHYAPYGDPWGAQGTNPTNFGFTGEQTDANGLLYLRARYYDPALGVFPSLDPLEGQIERAMSLNRYAYVVGNVVNLKDPSGEDCIPAICPTSSSPRGSQCCFQYRRSQAKQYALDYVISPNPNYDYYNNPRPSGGGWDTDCANFVSQALRQGNHPMSYRDAIYVDLHSLGLTNIRDYWFCVVNSTTSKCVGTGAWRAARDLSNYLKHPSRPTTYLTGSSVTPPENVRRMLARHLFQEGLYSSGIRVGDVLYLDPPGREHVAIVVGWGPIVLEDKKYPHQDDWDIIQYPTNLSDDARAFLVPYVVDHGGQGRYARPYYTLRWNLETGSPSGGYHAGADWEFIKIPDEVCVELNDLVT